MRLLLDTRVWGGAVKHLERAGHDVVWVGDWRQDPGDEEILEKAELEGRVLVTLDKDFGELVFVRGQRHCGIIRLVNLPARKQARACLRVLKRYGQELRSSAVVTADPARVRIRPGQAW